MNNTWKIITIGHLTKNKFWGEDETLYYRPALATCTLISSKHGNILVDPSLPGSALAEALFQNSGLKPEDISLIYVTHRHNDHWMGTDFFPHAQMYMASEDFKHLKRIQHLMSEEKQAQFARFLPAGSELVPGIQTVNLPGHTPGVCGLLFEANEGRILISGDAVMSAEFFEAREGYYFGFDALLSQQSITYAADIADYIIPGHGNYFCTKAYPHRKCETVGCQFKPYQGKYNFNTRLSTILEDPRTATLFHELLPVPYYNDEFNLQLDADMPLHAIIPLALGEEKIDIFFQKLNTGES